MAVYSSYKKIDGSSLPPGSVTAGKLNATGLDTWNVNGFMVIQFHVLQVAAVYGQFQQE